MGIGGGGGRVFSRVADFHFAPEGFSRAHGGGMQRKR